MVKTFQQPNYLANFVQSIFDALPSNELTGSTLLVSGDGRFFNREAANLVIRMAAANGVRKIICAQNFLLATPAASAVIRARKAYGGIVLTASHNPGGPDADFGIKYNISNGGPAPESLTNRVYQLTQKITQYKIADGIPEFDASQIGVHRFGDNFEVEVFDSSTDYIALLRSIFDFDALKAFLARPDFKFTFDGMNGVAGAHATRIFVEELGVQAASLHNCTPKPDFGGCHPDPNLTYAEELVARMGLNPEHAPADEASIPDFGAAADGDADRNMILGRKFFVTPSDSVAVLAANASEAIPYFKRNGIHGVARSMPTSQALDRVAAALNLPLYEVPTGWKFFGNLMDAGRLSICGEESFGTGSDHIREKDGIWAVLAWLSILQYHNSKQPAGSPLISVQSIVEEHWRKYGRNYYSRFDYENVASEGANAMMAHLNSFIERDVVELDAELKSDEFQVAKVDQFSYTDPVDGSVSSKQGFRMLFKDGSRLIFRLSGTGSVGATVRVYIERYINDPDRLNLNTQDALKSLVQLVDVSRLREFTGRDAPTVIT